jgi:hypothetical protein
MTLIIKKVRETKDPKVLDSLPTLESLQEVFFNLNYLLETFLLYIISYRSLFSYFVSCFSWVTWFCQKISYMLYIFLKRLQERFLCVFSLSWKGNPSMETYTYILTHYIDSLFLLVKCLEVNDQCYVGCLAVVFIDQIERRRSKKIT